MIIAQVTYPCDGPAHDAAVALLAAVKSAVPAVRWRIDAADAEPETGLLTVQLLGSTNGTPDLAALRDRLNATVDVGDWSVGAA